jgi:phospholipid/cholesterol/gamma-HCH transport system ATP-binding protein
VLVDDEDYWAATETQQRHIRQRFGVLFQSAALWTSMSVLDNVVVPLELKAPDMAKGERRDRALELLSWVGMEDAADKRPSDLSGGMKKRAGLARAIAGEPDFLFFDEPSAGLDPISAVRLDKLITDLRDRTGAAVLIVSHELESLLSIADDGIFLDAESKRPIARGRPADLKAASDTHPTVRAFLARQEPSS